RINPEDGAIVRLLDKMTGQEAGGEGLAAVTRHRMDPESSAEDLTIRDGETLVSRPKAELRNWGWMQQLTLTSTRDGGTVQQIYTLHDNAPLIEYALELEGVKLEGHALLL